MGVDFSLLSIPVLLVIFFAAATVVWLAGGKLTAVADEMAARTGVGRAFIGVLLLGGITSLPEVATTITASVEGNAGMAVSNVLGGVSMQVTILAVVDFWVRKSPISTSTSTIVILIQGLLLTVMLAAAAIFVQVPSFNLWHVGTNSILMFVLFLFSLYLVHRFSAISWISYDAQTSEQIGSAIDNLSQRRAQLEHPDKRQQEEENNSRVSIAGFLKQKGGRLLLLSLTILVAGFFVVKTSENIAAQTGMSASFAGLVLVAITTSLPEISTTISAIKGRQYDMAFSNIFGTNLFDVALIFLADLLFTKGPVFAELDSFTVVAALHGVILTTIYLTGIAIRSRRTVLRLGIDSWLIIIVYLLGIALLYTIKG